MNDLDRLVATFERLGIEHTVTDLGMGGGYALTLNRNCAWGFARNGEYVCEGRWAA